MKFFREIVEIGCCGVVWTNCDVLAGRCHVAQRLTTPQSFCQKSDASGSSHTTRRHHLGKEHLSEYLTLIDTRKLPNKLPDALLKQRQEQRARDLEPTAFSIQAFEDQLITVVVSNDLVSSTLRLSSVLINLCSAD